MHSNSYTKGSSTGIILIKSLEREELMKTRRHFAIKDILLNERISTQEELCEALKDRGYVITQATVSRDIKDLSLVKVADENGYHYALPGAHERKNSFERVRRVFKDLVMSINFSENIIVIKTTPGAAQSVGLLVDSLNHKNILGNVAGDDTILVIVKPHDAVYEVVGMFKELLNDS
jgi:transcriptional regulator of arginine metabolism